MAHRDSRSYYRSFQRYYRSENFKLIRGAAWMVLALLVLMGTALFAP